MLIYFKNAPRKTKPNYLYRELSCVNANVIIIDANDGILLISTC